jgi:NTE family protein
MKNFFLAVFLIFFTVGCELKNYHYTKETPKESRKPNRGTNIALVLSGAGSKGIVHAGVLAALSDNKVPIDLLVGSSAGALVGLLYADSHDTNKVKNILMKSQMKDFISGSPSSNFVNATLFGRPAKLYKFEDFIDKNITNKHFEQLKTPLVIVTTDITNNKSKIYNSGPFKAAIISSCSIPGLFRPVEFDGIVHVDGGVISPVPTAEAKAFKPKLIIAVNLVGKPPKEAVKSNFSMLYRSSWITYHELARMEQREADMALNIDTSDFDWLDNLSHSDKNKLYQRGYDAATKLIKQNRHLLKK